MPSNSLLLPGDRILIPDNIYPPVRAFCVNYLKPRGIDYAESLLRGRTV